MTCNKHNTDTVLTLEDLIKTHKLLKERGMIHPCSHGHMIPGFDSIVDKKSIPCLNCGQVLIVDL